MAIINSSRFNAKEATDWGISKFCEAYHGEVIEALDEVLPQVAREAVKKLKATSPKRPERGAKYSKGWTYKREGGRLTVGVVIYGKDGTYQLAHLLEKGHAKRGGGRTNKYEHIKPVEEWLNEEAVDRVIERLR